MTKKELLSETAKRIPPSGTMRMGALSRELEEKGKVIIHLEIGQPNFNTPLEIIEEAHKAMINGKTGYTSSRGIQPLRDKIAQVHSMETGVEINSKKNVIVNPGAKAALFGAMIAILNPRENMIVISPYWPSYAGIANFIGAKVKPVHAHYGDFEFPEETIKDSIDKATKALLINCPSNPTGAIYELASLKFIKDMSEENDLIIVTDEIYKKIVFESEYHQYLSVSQSLDRTVVIDGFSKSHAMTGWRIGYAIGNEAIVDSMNKIQQNTTTCVNAPTQWAAIKAFELQEPVREMVAAYKERRDKAWALIKQSDNLSCRKPEGAFYLFIKYKGEISSEQLATKLLEEKGVAVTPGSVFGVEENYIRVSLASKLESILEGLKRLDDLLNGK